MIYKIYFNYLIILCEVMNSAVMSVITTISELFVPLG